MADVGLAARSAFWTIVFPGTIAGYLPWRLFGVGEAVLDLQSPRVLLAVVAAGAGAAVLLTTVWAFAHHGRGTLSPADPPRALVVQGLYRYVRNPMYLGVTLVLLGETLLVASPSLLAYWAVWFAAVNLFVIGYEEPYLRTRFGESYERYLREVGRWVPRLPRGSHRI